MNSKSNRRYSIKEYIELSGISPFRKWLNSLDLTIKAKIQARIFRAELGNLGDYKSIGSRLYELRLNFGPGYRIYFSFYFGNSIILLNSGNKANQSKDIEKAKEYFKNFLMSQ